MNIKLLANYQVSELIAFRATGFVYLSNTDTVLADFSVVASAGGCLAAAFDDPNTCDFGRENGHVSVLDNFRFQIFFSANRIEAIWNEVNWTELNPFLGELCVHVEPEVVEAGPKVVQKTVTSQVHIVNSGDVPITLCPVLVCKVFRIPC